MSFKISYRTIGNFICALAGILSMNPYFVWPTFKNGMFTVIVYLVYALSILVMMKRGPKLKGGNLLTSFMLLLLYIITYLHTYGESKLTQKIGGLLLFLYLISFCNLSKENKIDIFKMFIKVFVLTLIPGLIYYIFELMGISLSIGILQSKNQLTYAQSIEGLNGVGMGYYKLYIGAVMRVSSNTRFSGIYDEAGLVGTVAALCLIANKMELKNRKSMKILLIAVMISFSLAGYILLLGYFLLNSIKKQRWKLVLGCIFVIIIGYILLTFNFDNELIKTLQERIIVENGTITIVNNRVSSKFDIGYSQFENANILTKLIGFGRGAATANEYINGSSSYKCSIYNYGYLGFSLMIITIIFAYRNYMKNIFNQHWYEFCLLVIFMISIYQRPAIYYPYYFIILYGGAAFISSKTANLNQKRKEDVMCK